MAEHSQESEHQEARGKDISAIVGNMVLAHEVIVNDGFELGSIPDNSFEKTIQSIVHKAFWANIQEQLLKQPPDYTAAFQLLTEIKETIFRLISPKQENIKKEIEQTLDFDLIKQEVENDCFNLHDAANFIVSMLLKICAPARDQEIRSILEKDGPVEILRGIMEALSHMKLDMANAQLQLIKPYLIQQSVDYERGKFKEYLEANPDGLRFTKVWLTKAHDHFRNLQQHARSASPPRINSQISPSMILTEAYLSLLIWEENRIYPETLLMDEIRLRELSHTLHTIKLALSIIHMAQCTLGMRLTSDREYNASLKKSITVLLKEVPQGSLQDFVSTSIYEQVVSDTNKFLDRRGYSPLAEEDQMTFKSQLNSVVNGVNPARNLVGTQLRDFVLLTMATDQKLQIPSTWTLMDEELSSIVGKFSRLVKHNERVFEPIYLEIINEILTTAEGNMEL